MEYLSPGVYVEEVDTGPRPIEGVSTSTAGFIGLTRRGSEQVELVTSYPEFVRRYGGRLDHRMELTVGADLLGRPGYLARAVQGFFENGGQRLFVQRVLAGDAVGASRDLVEGIITRLAAEPLSNDYVDVVSTYGIEPNSPIDFQVGSTRFSRTVVSVDAERGRVHLAAGSGAVLGLSPRDTAVLVPPIGGPALTVEARDRGAWGDDVEVKASTSFVARTPLVAPFRIPLAPNPAITLTVAPPATGSTDGALIDDQNVDVEAPGDAPAVDDWIELRLGSHVERRRLTAVSTSAATRPTATHRLSWADPVDAALVSAPASDVTIQVVSVTRNGDPTVFVDPTSVSLLGISGRFVLSGGGEQLGGLTVTPSLTDPGQLTLNPAPTTEFLLGAVLVLETVGAPSGSRELHVSSARQFYEGAVIQVAHRNGDGLEVDREYHRVDAVEGNVLLIPTATTHSFDQGDYVTLCEHTLRFRYNNPADGVNQEETFDRLSFEPGAERYVETIVNARSKLVQVTLTAGMPSGSPPGVTTLDGSWEHLAGGSDGATGIPTEDDYIGEDRGPGRRSGIHGLSEVDEVSIVAVPGIWSRVVQNAVITHCELLADRFGVLDPPLRATDPPQGATVQEVQDHRNLYDTQFAALYYPWLTLRERGNQIEAPPSGHMVGIYARTDTTRGVWKAPANVVVRGIVGLQQTLTKREQDILNPSPTNVNVIRDFTSRGRGIRVWGARCMTSDTPWNYVSVRRLFLFLEESIEDGTQWAVFEPNDEKLWARLRQSVSGFLKTQWRAGALLGETPEQAFFVKCDRSTMTQDDLDNGRLIMLIGVAPVRPAEFVIIRIGQWDGGSSVEEI